jgi:hypothetical protein
MASIDLCEAHKDWRPIYIVRVLSGLETAWLGPSRRLMCHGARGQKWRFPAFAVLITKR